MKSLNRVRLLATPWAAAYQTPPSMGFSRQEDWSGVPLPSPHGLYSSWNSAGQHTGVGSLSLLQGIFSTQGLNPGLLHCRWILYPAEPQGKSIDTRVGSIPLLQRIFPTQESNQGLLHCRWILYKLSYRTVQLLQHYWGGHRLGLL